MARTVRDVQLGSRNARLKLKPNKNQYWRHIEEGLHLGYRRLKGRAGTWWVRHYVGAQQYHFEGIGAADDLSDADGRAILSFEQAQKIAREKMVKRVHSDGKSKPLTVADAMVSYLEYLEAEKKTAHDARVRHEAFIAPTFGKLLVADLEADQIKAWHRGLAKKGARIRTRKGEAQRRRDLVDDEAIRRRKSSANRNLTVLKAALNMAFNDGKVSSDKEWRRVKPFKDVDIARIRYLNTEEARRLVNACGANFRPIVQAALLTGCRYGELSRLTVSDFNPDSETISIQTSKSGKSRHVVLNDDGVKFFRRICAGREDGQLLFTKASGAPWGKSHQKRQIDEACTHAKIKPITFHGLRHTWASIAVMNGVPLLVVAKNLGHSDTRMVEKHYGHLAPDYMKKAIKENAPKFGFRLDNVQSIA
jgi:integrase